MFCLALLGAGLLLGQPINGTVRVGLFHGKTVKDVLLMSDRGPADVLADGRRVGAIAATDGLRITAGTNGTLVAKSLKLAFSAAERIEIVPRRPDGGFRLKATGQNVPERRYPGPLQVDRSGGGLRLVATPALDDYVAGVVRAEAGNHHHIEYYKLQSVSCRTYALSNLRKHLKDGFAVCDQVHCQLFRGRNDNDTIAMAVAATHDLVIVDPAIRLIHATFHSNCGGETVNAEDVWSYEPYLRATTDTFCTHADQATWERTFPRSEWLGYLRRKHGFTADGPAALAAVLEYEPQCRDLYLGNTTPLIPLKTVREDLKLRSTYFGIRTEGEKVVLQGRGFGHGVGLCQEGAMRMARAGRPYTGILHHYYTGVHLVELGTLDFFREEEPVPGGDFPTGM
jgi:stage II sporulation protein D